MSDDSFMLDEFVEEAHEHLQQVDIDLLRLERDGFDQGLVDAVFRGIHSIKGASGFLNLQVIGTLAHAAENLLDALRSGDIPLNQALIDILLQASQGLSDLIADIRQSNEVDVRELITQLEAVLTDALDPTLLASMTQSVSISSVSDAQLNFAVNAYTYDHLAYPRLYEIHFAIAELQQAGRHPVQIVRTLLQVGQLLDGATSIAGGRDLRRSLPAAAMVRLLVATDCETTTLAAQLDLDVSSVHAVELVSRPPGSARQVAATEALEPHTEECQRLVGTVVDSEPPVWDPMPGDEISDATATESLSATDQEGPASEIALATRIAPATESEQRSEGHVRRSAIKVDGQRLDHLLDLIGELVIAETMVCQSPQVLSSGDPELAKRVSQLDKITRELQEMGTGLRMVPVKGCFQRMARLVRDIARKLDKPVALQISGEETELDKNVVERIGDPLVHMLRNAIDHGLEDRAGRQSAGKDPTGLVQLCAYHKGGYIYIEVTDDGRGLDAERIRAKAIERGLISAEALLEDKDIFNLVFEPGFSTAAAISDVSGRGVGMDVVRRNIEELRGQVDITSTSGRGSCFSIRLPLTMAIIDGMTVRVAADRFIIPTASIVMTAAPKPSELTTALGRGELWSWQDHNIPLYRLDRIFGIGAVDEVACPHQVVVVEEDGRFAALAIDELCSQQQVVIKPLGGLLQGLPGITGGAVMPDGRVGLILETGGILRVAEHYTRHGHLPRQEGASMSASIDAAAGTHQATPGKYLSFRLGGEHYGIRILSAQEIIGMMEITSVPWTPPFVRGVLNLRGKVIPIIDLRRRFGLDSDVDSERCIMVIQVESASEVMIMGIIIDQVPDVFEIETDQIEEAPPFCSGIDAEFVIGVAKTHDRVLMLLDSDRLLSPQEFTTIKNRTATADPVQI